MADVKNIALDGESYEIAGKVLLDKYKEGSGNYGASITLKTDSGVTLPPQTSAAAYPVKLILDNGVRTIEGNMPRFNISATTTGIAISINDQLSKLTPPATDYADASTIGIYTVGGKGQWKFADASARTRLDTAEGNITQLQTDVAAANTAASNAQSRADAAYSLAESAGGGSVRIVTTAAEFNAANIDTSVSAICINGRFELDNPTVRKPVFALTNLTEYNLISGTINSQGATFTGVIFDNETTINGSNITLQKCICNGTFTATCAVYAYNTTFSTVTARVFFGADCFYGNLTTTGVGSDLTLVGGTATAITASCSLSITGVTVLGQIIYNPAVTSTEVNWFITSCYVSASNFAITCPGAVGSGYAIINGNRFSAGDGSAASIKSAITGNWFGSNLYYNEWN